MFKKRKLDSMDNDTAICPVCHKVIAGGEVRFLGTGIAHLVCPR